MSWGIFEVESNDDGVATYITDFCKVSCGFKGKAFSYFINNSALNSTGFYCVCGVGEDTIITQGVNPVVEVISSPVGGGGGGPAPVENIESIIGNGHNLGIAPDPIIIVGIGVVL